MPPVVVLPVFVGNVAFGKTGDARAKIAGLADEFHKLRREFKAAGRRPEFAAAGRVAAQGEDVFAAGRADFVQQRPHLVARVAHAGEMRQRRQPVPPLDAIHDFERLVARGAARAVGDGAEIRPGLQQRGDVLLQQRMVALVRLGREKFKSDGRFFRRLFRRVNVANEMHLEMELYCGAK